MQNRLFIFEGPIERSPSTASADGRSMVGFQCGCGQAAYGIIPAGVEVKEDLAYLTGVLDEDDREGLEGFLNEHEAAKHAVTAVFVPGKFAAS